CGSLWPTARAELDLLSGEDCAPAWSSSHVDSPFWTRRSRKGRNRLARSGIEHAQFPIMTTRLRQALLFPILMAFLAVLAFPSPSAAHPADELLQHLQVDLSPRSIEITISIGGGVLAKEFLIADLDQDQNGAASASEIATWSQKLVQH